MIRSWKPIFIAAMAGLVGFASLPAAAAPAAIEVQYRDGDRFDRGFDDRRDFRRHHRDRYDRDRYERGRFERYGPPRYFEGRNERRGYDRTRLTRRDRACLSTYRSYNPQTGLYRDLDGRLRRCRF